VTTSQGTYFAQPSFARSNSGSTLTGGIDSGGAQPIYDAGTASVTINSITSSVGYGQGSTTSTVATALAQAINTNNTYVTATASGARVNFTSKTTGASTNFGLSSASATTQTAYFSGTSFPVTTSGTTLTGGFDASTGAATIYQYSLAYKPNGNVSTANDSSLGTTLNGNWTYAYDEFNRLASSNKNSGAQTFTYGYDRYGNRVSQSQGPTYTFDANNRISQTCGTGRSFTYDAVGNMIYDCNHDYTYDAENRIVAVDANGATYDYDAEGRRVRSVVGSTTQNYIYDLAGRVVSVKDASGTLVRGEIYADGVHLGSYDATTTYFSHTDWLGSERVRSNMSAMVANSSTSLPFGDGMGSSGISPMQFTGLEHESIAEGGLEHTLFRKYSAIQGRWLSPDPYAGSMDLANPQSLNRYSYVQNDPVNAYDPLGLDLVWIGHCLFDRGWTQTGTPESPGEKVEYNDFLGCGDGGPSDLPSVIPYVSGDNEDGTPNGGEPTGRLPQIRFLQIQPLRPTAGICDGTVRPLGGNLHVTTQFGAVDKTHSKPHTGIDYAAPVGTPVMSPQSGTVVLARYSNTAGNFVGIQNQASTSLLLHLSQIQVSTGQQVNAGNVIGLSGNTGHSTGAHLHYELHTPGPVFRNGVFNRSTAVLPCQ
jgi:RHS repeat-associated protein